MILWIMDDGEGVDSEGRRWRRDPDGVWREVDQPAPERGGKDEDARRS